MNILANYNLNFGSVQNNNNYNNTLSTSFGLKLAAPISCDTVQFTGTQSKKDMRDRRDAINEDLAIRIRNVLKEPHERNRRLFKKKFSDILSTDDQKNLITMTDRIKLPNSICEKSATRGWTTKKDILNNMGDISGFCFVMEDKKSFPEFIKRFSEMVKDGDIRVTEVEYHRLAPEYKKNSIVKSYDSLPQDKFTKLKNAIIDKQCPTTQFWKDVDSMSGYSGLHITLKNPDGTKSEVQVMTRAMANLKDSENLLYKIRNNKSINAKYRFIENFLSPLKVKDTENMTPREKAVQKAMKNYTKEAYIDVLNKPFDDSYTYLKVEDATTLTRKEKDLIGDYDFNTIHSFMETCKQVDKRKGLTIS